MREEMEVEKGEEEEQQEEEEEEEELRIPSVAALINAVVGPIPLHPSVPLPLLDERREPILLRGGGMWGCNVNRGLELSDGEDDKEEGEMEEEEEEEEEEAEDEEIEAAAREAAFLLEMCQTLYYYYFKV